MHNASYTGPGSVALKKGELALSPMGLVKLIEEACILTNVGIAVMMVKVLLP